MGLRHYAREKALKLLYQGEIWAISENKSLVESRSEISDSFSTKRIKPETKKFIQQLFNGVLDHLEELDDLIVTHSAGWSLERLSHITRNVLRLALWEILYAADIPEIVSINEAVELAKKFSDPKDAGYVNALLENVVREKSSNQ